MTQLRQFDKHMAGESSSGFHHQQKQKGILLKSGGSVSSSSSSSGSGSCQFIRMGNYYGNPVGSLNLSASDGATKGIIFSPGGSQNSLESSSAILLDSMSGLKHDTGLAVEWSIDEQYKLEEGLVKYSHEPNIMQYIKIAASLRDKTVRDVALRCSWMMRKRRKEEDQSLGKNLKSRREKLAESSLSCSISSVSSINKAPYSFPRNQSGCMVSGVQSGTTGHLLEENNQAFLQISENLLTLKLWQNMDLLFRARNNIIKILNDMSNMPGIMSQMPPLPVLLNDNLAYSILPCSSQPMLFSSSSAIPLKLEPGC